MTAWLGAGGEILQEGARRQEEEQGARIHYLEEPRSQDLQLVRRRQRVILNGKASKWHLVTASIIQGSCLGPTLAKSFSNSSHQGRNLHKEDKPFVSKFADDEKRARIVNDEDQGQRMQQDINHMVSWTQKMGVELNEDKVHLLHLGQNNPRRPYILGEEGPPIEVVDQEKDLGVIVSSDMKQEKMVARQAQKAHLKLTQFNTTFTYRGTTWLQLYKTYIKPSLLYASEAWRPTTVEGIEKLEAVQKRAMRMAGGMGVRDYREACRGVGLNLIKEELEVSDMTRVYRIMYEHDKVDKTIFWKM